MLEKSAQELMDFIRSNMILKLNMSDVFVWGSSFFVDIDAFDVPDLFELYSKYGDVVCIAYASLNDDIEPENYAEYCPDALKDFNEAKAAILEMISQGRFKFLNAEMELRKKEIAEFGNTIEWERGQHSRWSDFKHYSQMAFGRRPWRSSLMKGTIRGTDISAVDVNMAKVMDKLREKLRSSK